MFREDGYINMTKAAKHFRTRLDNFWNNHGTDDYMKALTAFTGIPGNVLIQAKRGGAKGQAGTWCHPKLAVFFARWLDVRFAVWCDLAIDNILKGNLVVDVAVPTEEALEQTLKISVWGPSGVGVSRDSGR